jgi:hypothetical protein
VDAAAAAAANMTSSSAGGKGKGDDVTAQLPTLGGVQSVNNDKTKQMMQDNMEKLAKKMPSTWRQLN